MTLRKILLCLSPLILSINSYSQPNSWYLNKVLNDDNGLPQNSVRTMYFDNRTAFLWMTTEAGLVRYDGVSSRVFDLRDLSSLKSIRMLHFSKTHRKELLVSNRDGEVFTIKDYPVNEIVAKDSVVNGFEDRKATIGSLEEFNLEDSVFKNELHTPELFESSFWINDYEWLALSESYVALFNHDKLLYKWDNKLIGKKYFLARNRTAYVLGVDGSGLAIDLVTKAVAKTKFYDKTLKSGKSVFYYDGVNDQPILLNENKLYELQFNKEQLSVNFIASLPTLPTYITSVLMHSNKKIIFISTNTTGVRIYRQSPFQVFQVTGDDRLNNNYASVLADSNHLLTCRSVLYDVSSGKTLRLPVGIGHDRSMSMDTSQNIWSGRTNAIIYFNINDFSKVHEIRLADDNYLQTSYLSSNGKLWISTRRFLGYIAKNKLIRDINYDGNADSSSFYFLTETPKGQLVGVNNRGVYAVDTTQKKNDLIIGMNKVKQIRGVYIDSSNLVWILTYGNGIFVYDREHKKLTKLPVDDKGYLLYSHAFIEDGYGNILVPTNKGLFKLGKKNLLEIKDKPGTPLYYHYFDVKDGLLTNEFNGGCQPAFNRLADGDIILPALKGLVRVNVAALITPEASPLFIEMIETKLNKYSVIKASMNFGKDERSQIWHLSFAQWNQPDNQGIFYRLDKDSVWKRLPADTRNIQLNELDGGSHHLDIKYQYGLLPGEYSSLEFKFNIGRTFYELAWFWLVALGLMILIVYGIVWYRNLRLKLKNKQLQEIISQNTKELHEKNADLEETLLDLNEALNSLKENSVFKNRLIGLLGHDMLVPLRFIASISDHLHNDAGTLSPEAARESSGEIKNTAVELLFLGESLLQWIKLLEGSFRLIVRPVNMQQLVNEITAVHKPVMGVKKNTLSYDILPGSDCDYDPVFLKVILHNLLLNANKFTSNGSININTRVDKNTLTISVGDTGTGMDPAIVTSLNNLVPVASNKGTNQESGWGMGYILIIDLLRFAGGVLNVHSSTGEGSVISFSLPLQGIERIY